MSSTTPFPIWRYTDSDPNVTAQLAMATARTGTWASIDSTTRIRYLRALLIITLQAGLLRTEAPRPSGPEGDPEYGDFKASDYPDDTRLFIASTLLRTPMLLVPAGSYVVHSVKTVDGEPATFFGPGHTFETGFAPLVWVVAIVAVTIITIVTEQIMGNVVDRKLEREEDTKRLLGTQAKAIDVVSLHLDRENKTGHPIDWTPEELGILSELLKVQTTIVEKKSTPLPSPFPGATAALKGLGKGLENLGEGGKDALDKVASGFEWALPIVAVGALIFLWPRSTRGEENKAYD